MTLERWQRLTYWPLTVAAGLFLVVYAWAVIGNLHGHARIVPDIIDWTIWGVFVVDYLVSLLLARPRWRWFYRHIPQLLIVVLPMLRPLQLLRLLTVFRVFSRRSGAALRGRVTVYVVVTAVLLVLIGALAELDAEQNAVAANIRSFGDSLWWAVVTITTVGYGDFYPVTLVGRLVAVVVMVAGVALIGTVTATIASWIVQQVAVPAVAASRAPATTPAGAGSSADAPSDDLDLPFASDDA